MRDDLIVTSSTTADDVEGWDSLKQIDIVLALESKFQVKLHTRELDQLKNVGDLVHALMSRSKQ